MEKIKKLISFRLTGKFAHFKKFYTNSSSLTYLIPPRTTIIGLLASILKMPRDSYYVDFNIEEFRISVAVSDGCKIKKNMQSVNYLHYKYHPFLCNMFFKEKNDDKKKKENESTPAFHGPNKLELLMPDSLQNSISYHVYVGTTSDKGLRILNEIIDSISNNNYGYGVYLGQRQFRGQIEGMRIYEENDLNFFEFAESLNSIALLENSELDLSDSEVNIITDQMPLNMEKVNNKKGEHDGRQLQQIKRFVYEKEGKTIHGRFKNCWKVDDKIISFFET